MRFQRIFRIRPMNVQLWDVPETDASRDAYGQVSSAPTLVGIFPMAVQPLRGQEQLNVRAVWPTATHQVWSRWLGSAIPAGPTNPSGLILPRMYLVLSEGDGSRLDVSFAENVEERGQFWKLTCEQKVAT